MKTQLLFIPSLAALLAGCVTATPYQPLQHDGGYSEQKIESNRYRVRFVGNDSTPRETVEDYLLYRAAEVTLSNGFDYFLLANQNTEANQSYYHTFGFGGWYRYYWGPRLDVGMVSATTEYEANVNIVMFKGKKPEKDIKAFDAAEVKANLEPHIVRPEK